MSLVSVGLPFYNSAATILDAVRSVYAQTHTDWELILIDDGSVDNSWELVASLQDARVKLVRDGKNIGLAARLNQIATLARGELLARMDADDLMHPERLERQLAFIETHPQYDFVASGKITIDVHGEPMGISLPDNSASNSWEMLAHGGWFVHPSILGSTRWFQKNPYDETYPSTQDLELWVRTREHRRSFVIPEPLIFYRDVGTVTAEKYATHAKANRQVIRTYGPDMIGRPGTVALTTVSHLKEWVYRLAHHFGMLDLLVKNRTSTRLTTEEYADAVLTLSEVRTTRLPLGDLDGRSFVTGDEESSARQPVLDDSLSVLEL
jgi:glycosyltransferase involved in cell wall biosynthesis